MPSTVPPLPSRYNDWKAWANSYIAFQTGETSVQKAAEPQPVLLSHLLGPDAAVLAGTRLERATTDGILMFDPNIGSPVYSVGGTWLPLTSTFTGLIDTPASYAGSASYALTVNGAEDGLEFTDLNTRYLQLSGGTMTGTIVFDNLGALKLIESANDSVTYFNFGRTTAGGRLGLRDPDNTLFARFDEAGTSAGNTTTVITREKGDARYLQLSGGTVTGNLTLLNQLIINGAGTSSASMYFRSTAAAYENRIYHADNGALTVRADEGGANQKSYEFRSIGTETDSTILIRADADARYLQLSGGTLTGNLNVSAQLLSVGITGSANLTFNRTNGPGLINSGNTDLTGFQFAFRNATPSVVARVEGSGTSAPNVASIITREKGDARYVQQAAAAANTIQPSPVVNGQYKEFEVPGMASIFALVFEDLQVANNGHHIKVQLGTAGTWITAQANYIGASVLTSPGVTSLVYGLGYSIFAQSTTRQLNGEATFYRYSPDKATLKTALGGGPAGPTSMVHSAGRGFTGAGDITRIRVYANANLTGTPSDWSGSIGFTWR